MKRTFYLDNPKLIKMLQDKEQALREGQEQYKLVEKEQQKLNKCGLRIQKYKDKAIPFVTELTKDILGEYEDLTALEVKDGRVALTIVDKVAEFKQAWLDKKYGDQKNTGTKTGTDEGDTKK